MKCVICKQGETAPGPATVVLQRGPTIVVVKDVPADLCRNCGEHYLPAESSQRVLAIAESAVAQEAEIEIVRFAA